MKCLEKIKLKGITEILNERELKSIVGGYDPSYYCGQYESAFYCDVTFDCGKWGSSTTYGYACARNAAIARDNVFNAARSQMSLGGSSSGCSITAHC